MDTQSTSQATGQVMLTLLALPCLGWAGLHLSMASQYRPVTAWVVLRCLGTGTAQTAAIVAGFWAVYALLF